MNRYFLLFILFLCVPVKPQITPGVRQIALGGAAVTDIADIFTCYTNDAAPARLRSPQTGFFFSPAPFGMYELRTVSAAAAVPVFDGSASFSVLMYGFDLYKLHRVQLGYAYRLKSTFSAGGSLEFTNLRLRNYGSGNALQMNAGLLYDVFPSLRWGASIRNIAEAKIGRSDSPLPVRFSTGFSFTLDDMELQAGIQKEKGIEESFVFGFLYRFNTMMEIMAGYSTLPAQMNFGTAITYQGISAQYCVTNNELLGYTHQFGLIVSLPQFKFIP